MRTIFEYPLSPTDVQVIALPREARPLYAAAQYDSIVLYAMVVPDLEPAERYRVYVVGTGGPITFGDDAQPMGVVSLMGGRLMFHVFVEREEETPT